MGVGVMVEKIYDIFKIFTEIFIFEGYRIFLGVISFPLKYQENIGKTWCNFYEISGNIKNLDGNYGLKISNSSDLHHLLSF